MRGRIQKGVCVKFNTDVFFFRISTRLSPLPSFSASSSCPLHRLLLCFLLVLQVKQRELEGRGVAVEMILRGEGDDESKSEADLMQEWFNLVYEKNVLVR